MDLDELVRRADPARDLVIPAAHHAAVRWDCAEVVGKPPGPTRRKRLVAGSGAVVACAVVVVVALVLVPTVEDGSNAAAAVLEEAASASAGQPAAPLGPGQYQYTATMRRSQITAYQPQSTGSTFVSVADVQYQQTTQSWLDGEGTGRIASHRTPYQYSSPADETAWNAVPGGPTLGYSSGALTNTAPVTTRTLPDVSGLPTDPAALATIIGQGRDGTDVTLSATGPGATFERAARLLIGPDNGMTPALEAALYQVMASQPGITLVGSATAHDGRAGTAVALDVATGVNEVIVDPSTGALLEAQFAPPPPSIPKASITGGTCVGGPPPASSASGSPGPATCTPRVPVSDTQSGPLWIDLLARAVVSSDTATTS